MKVITLNTWGGLAGKDLLLSFFEKYKNDTDIFCLQEVWSGSIKELEGKIVAGKNLEHNKIMIDGLLEISKILPNYIPYFRPHLMDRYGLAVFVKKDLKVIEESEIFVHRERGAIPSDDIGHHSRNIQSVKIDTKDGPRTVINFHGLWNGKGKGDSDERLSQSDKIVDFIKKVSNPVVLCGDFNLLPETESLKKFEKLGLRNLIKENNITSTRTSFYKKPERYADYVFTSKDVEVKSLKVLPEEVSDHSALLLDFE